jgi:hypothetical protein
MSVMTGTATYVKWSAALATDVPPSVVTRTSIVSALVPAGTIARMDVVPLTVTSVTDVVPNITSTTWMKPLPVMTTGVPPAVGPAAGLTLVTDGSGAYVNWSAMEVADVPPGVVTRMSTMPVPGAAVATIVVELVTEKVVAAVAPKVTAVAPLKLVPWMVTIVPPVSGPDIGRIPETVGAAT